MTQLGRSNATFAYTGVCGTGGTDTLILGRMVCFMEEALVQYFFFSFDFGRWKTTKLADGPIGCGEMASGEC